MLLFGHIGITAFLGIFFSLPFLLVGFSAILPDIIDKFLVLTGISPYTRLFAHNIFFGPFVSMIVYAITKRKDYALTVLFGTYMHLLLDMTHVVPLFWPLISYNLTPVYEVQITFGLFEIVSELVGISLLMVLFTSRQNILELRERLLINMREFYDRRIVKKI